LTSNSTGAGSQLLWDTSQVGFNLQETAKGQDALLLSGAIGAGGFVATSANDTFKNVLPGATITANAVSAAPVTLNVAGSTSNLSTAIQTLVDTYNTLQGTLSTDTTYNSTTNQSAVLQGDGSVLQVQTNLTNLLSSQLFGNGAIQSLAALGITFNQDGTLGLNANQLQHQLTNNPQALQQFFANSGTGLSDKLNGMLDQLAGPGSSLLDNDISAISATITSNKTRITTLQSKLTADQTRLTSEFTNMEVVVSRLQSNLQALSSIQGFATLGGQVGSSTSLNSSSGSSGGSGGSSAGNVGSAF
jgi:flagellar hook-associated protein 2